MFKKVIQNFHSPSLSSHNFILTFYESGFPQCVCGHVCRAVWFEAVLMKQMADWTEQLGQSSFHFSISCCLIKHQCLLDSTQSSIWLGRIKEALLSRKSSWQAGALRLIKLKPRVGRHRRLLAAESPGVKPCSMLLFPAPSRPSTRTWRFPRSSSSYRQTAEMLMFANAWKCCVEAKIKHITYSTQSEGGLMILEKLLVSRTSRRTLQQIITSRSEHQLF